MQPPDTDVLAWLSQNPGVSRVPSVDRPTPDREVWREVPEDESCFVCRGSGLVQADVMRRFAVPTYDVITSQPVRCCRSRICGWERLRVSSDNESREVPGHRWMGRNELPLLPKYLADRWDRILRDEARTLAMASPEEKAQRFADLRESVSRLRQKFDVDESRNDLADVDRGRGEAHSPAPPRRSGPPPTGG